jgi:hypothetical protein
VKKKENKGNALVQTAGVLVGLFIVIFVLSVLINLFFPERMGRGMFLFFEQFIMFKAIISSINSILLVYLIYNYITFYNEIKSQFSLGLIIIAVALLAYSITDNPLFPFLFGFRGGGLGAFAMIPSIFTLVAVLVLIYLSRK